MIISDFDGTITLQDVNDLLFNSFGDEENVKIEDSFGRGDIGVRESLSRQYKRLKLSEIKFYNFLRKQVSLDPHFKSFYQSLLASQYEFAIVSGGFINYIDFLLNSENINLVHQVYANQLVFEDEKIKPCFLHQGISTCDSPFGVCGNCKKRILNKYRETFERIIYIGDGLTDRCPAEQADIVFARSGRALEGFCQDKNIRFYSYDTFQDINQLLFAVL